MSERGNGQFPYDVTMSEHNKNILLQRHREAALSGKGTQFLAAYKSILQHLHKDPLIFGEPIYRLPALRLWVRQAMVCHSWSTMRCTRIFLWYSSAVSR